MQRNSIKFILLLSGASILFIISCSVGAVAYYFGQKKFKRPTLDKCMELSVLWDKRSMIFL